MMLTISLFLLCNLNNLAILSPSWFSPLQMYNGVSKQRFIQPRTLAKQDIVITTYETLCKEIDYVDLPHSNSMHH